MYNFQKRASSLRKYGYTMCTYDVILVPMDTIGASIQDFTCTLCFSCVIQRNVKLNL